jgi:fatty-acyl-CoA synthase
VEGDVYNPSLSSAIVETYGRFRDQECFVMGSERITYAEGAGQISQIQQLLVDLGVGYHGQVVLLSPNSPEIWHIQAAAYLIGARYTGLHPLGSTDDYAWICDEAEADVVLVHSTYAEAGRQILERCATVRHLLVIGQSGVGDDLYERLRTYQPRPLEAGPATGSDIGWLQYTGGTTGKPKGVMVSHRALLEQTRVGLAWWDFPVDRPLRYLMVAPMTHAGTNGLFATLSRGRDHLRPRTSPQDDRGGANLVDRPGPRP